LEESRIGRFIDIGSRNRGLLPVPLRYYGAHTGRWSGYDAVNFQNLPSRDKKKKALKNAILAPPGYRIVNCDSSQIEARVLAWLAGQNDVVEAFAQKRDIYCEDATKAFGRTITKKDEMERFVGKTMRLGLGYGTGATKLHSTLKLGGATISEDRCKDLVNSWRQHNNKITELWRKCDDALRDMMNWGPESKPYALGEHECLWVTKTGILLPNNLYIRYGNLRMHEGKAIYDSRKGPVNIWGGSVVENVVQALARIVIGEQMLAANAEYPVVLTVHDAIVCLVPEDSIDQGLARIVEIMSNPPRWGQSLPVACEAKHGPSYGDC
jgi:DNA polymerase